MGSNPVGAANRDNNLDNNRVPMSRIGVLNVVHTINRDKNDFKPSVAEMAIRSSLRDCRPRGLRVRLSPDGPISMGVCLETARRLR